MHSRKPSPPHNSVASATSSGSASKLPRPPTRPGTAASARKPAAPSSSLNASFSATSSSPTHSKSPLPSSASGSTSDSANGSGEKGNLESLCSSLFALCANNDDSGAVDQQAFLTQLNAIRSHILFHGIPANQAVNATTPSHSRVASHVGTTSNSSTNSSATPDENNSLRGRIWQLMLGIGSVSASQYLSMIERKECAVYSKIRSDSFRTFPQDEQFQSRVSESSIVRLLNSFVWANGSQYTYVQGMNTIAAPMLYCMSELSAYQCFTVFITERTSLYWVSAHIGVQAGCKLVDTVLSIIDPELFAHLKGHNMSSYLYAFHCVSSFSASVPPFSELLVLWDFLLAFGLHLNILCVVASITSMRQSLLASKQPNNELNYRKWPKMRAREWISMALTFVTMIDEKLYEDIRRHPFDREVAERITGRKVEHKIQ